MTNQICEALNITKPVVQGPLGWITDARLVAAVSNAGGLGCLGPNAGQTTVTKSPQETAERMRREVKKVRQLTDKPFAVNLYRAEGTDVLGNDVYFTPMLKMVLEENVPAVVYSGELHEDIVSQLKEHNVKIIFRELNPTIAGTKKAEKLGVDVIVATGFDEGGMLPSKVIGTFSIVPMIVDAVDHTPVMAAGGICDNRSAKAAFDLGAQGLFCGSAFIPVDESPVAQNIKEQIVNSTGEDLGLFRSEPSYWRSLPGKKPAELLKLDKELAPNAEINKAMGGTQGMRVGMLMGDTDNGYVSTGTGIGTIHEIKPVKDVIDELCDGLI
ncbi:NAD(P)H-dependent flavin oxidoreductase [Limosilactobacillus sp.]|jgi:enoyl-[acyl-carrier protein] reductase II|uniref:NAD(P)H-dependent flavin oxidoreductase n=1 Tax=Limosilactobacillus sp. TaxID=2773925 RepID=UPI0025BBE130|nr:nitronate monooxygenase [Limosilactobacillus sp.]MCH3921869.1 nitronate monooxygenase [Limosilactobacillus sp.]MCH3928640.1 nitronate monooxygenase [Limosilactobacillus sp.]